MLHQRRAHPCVLSRNKSVQTLPSHAFTREKSSEQTSCAIASAIGSSKAFGVLQRRRGRHSRPETAGRILHSGDLATIAPYPSSRSSTLFNGSSKLSAFAVKGRPLWESTKPRNHSRRARARAATASSSPGKAFARIVSLWLGSISLACTSHAKRSFPLGIHSTTVSTGVPIELRKSSPGSSAMNIGEGRFSDISD